MVVGVSPATVCGNLQRWRTSVKADYLPFSVALPCIAVKRLGNRMLDQV
jgi:hypothetical protein